MFKHSKLVYGTSVPASSRLNGVCEQDIESEMDIETERRPVESGRVRSRQKKLGWTKVENKKEQKLEKERKE